MPVTIESWVLGGVALTSGAFTLMELTADPPRERRDWITAADSEDAALFRQPKHENRVITMKLRVTAQASMDAALDQVAALVDKLRLSSATGAGISLVWTPTDSARSRTFTVLAGEIVGMPIATQGEGVSWVLRRPIVTVELTCKPYWLGTRVLVSSASSSVPLVTQEITGVTGDVPALGELFVTDNATQSRRHVEWGVEGLYYNAATVLILESDSLVVSGFAGAQTTRTGAYDPGAAGNNAIIATGWNTPVAMCGTGNQSHVGTFKVKARVQMPAVIQMRLAWRAGDGPWTANAWAESPAPATFSAIWSEVDLGSVTVPPVVVGTQRWEGRVEIIASGGAVGVDQAVVDYLELIPQLEGYGKVRATYIYSPGVIVGTDSFVGTTAAAALNARVAPSGGTWATSGDATDFAFADAPLATDETVTRSAISGTAGRFALLGTGTPTDVQVQARVRNEGLPTSAGPTLDCGVVARYVDASNYLYATFRRSYITYNTNLSRTLEIRQVVAGVDSLIASGTFPVTGTSGIWWSISLTAYASGSVSARLLSAAGAEMASAAGVSTALATAGALASGKSGLFDRNTSAVVFARYYDDFAVITPAAEPIAIYSGRNMQIRYDDVLRQDSTGTYTGPPPSYRGSRFLVPVGTSRVAVKARRNDVEAAADDNIADSITVQIAWTPRGLAVPR